MKKTIILLVLIFWLFACQKEKLYQKTTNYENKNIKTVLNQDNKESLELKNPLEEEKKWDWSFFNKDIKFIKCDSLFKYKNLENFYKTDINLKKINNIIFKQDLRFNDWIIEYCRNQKSTKYLIVSRKYNSLRIYQYDTSLKIIKKSSYKWYFNKYFIDWYYDWRWERNYGDTSLEKFLNEYIKNKSNLSGFWLNFKGEIPFSVYWVSLIWCAEWCAPWPFSSIMQFFSRKTIKYCNSGLTSSWKLSVCFADIFYDYNIKENKIEEKRLCSYYIDDNWNIRKLEKCIDFKNPYKGYNLISKIRGVNFYQNNSWDLSIIDIDLNIAGIDFWGVDKLSKQDLYNFKRHFASNFNYNYKKYSAYFFINWQFFDPNKNPTFLSFPLKSNWKIISDYMDNNISKRTFIIDNSKNAMILEWYKKDFLENKNYKELIVWFNPGVNANINSKIWRTYIWLLSSKKVVFFIAKNKTQDEMMKIILDYWIKKENIIMMDWWPSSQFAYFENDWPWSMWKQFYWWWKVPQVFVIYNK